MLPVMLLSFEMLAAEGWRYIEPMISCTHPDDMWHGNPSRCFLCNRSDGLAVAREVLAFYPSLDTVFRGFPSRSLNGFGLPSAKTSHAIRHWGGFDGWVTADKLAERATSAISFAPHQCALLLTIDELKQYGRPVTVFFKH